MARRIDPETREAVRHIDAASHSLRLAFDLCSEAKHTDALERIADELGSIRGDLAEDWQGELHDVAKAMGHGYPPAPPAHKA